MHCDGTSILSLHNKQEAIARIIERYSQVDQPPPSPLNSSSPSMSSSASDSEPPHEFRIPKLVGNRLTAKEVAPGKGGREGKGTHEAQAREEGISGGSGDAAIAGWLRASTQQCCTIR